VAPVVNLEQLRKTQNKLGDSGNFTPDGCNHLLTAWRTWRELHAVCLFLTDHSASQPVCRRRNAKLRQLQALPP